MNDDAQQDVRLCIEAVRAGDRDAVAETLARNPTLVSATHPGSFGATPLIHAVLCDDQDMVDLLLDAGAAIDQRSDWWAGSFGVLDHCSDAMSAHLLARGATLTPHAAARLGMIDALREMIRQDDTVVSRRGGDGQLPLHFARTPEIAELLLDAGAEIDARDIDHESTAAQWAAASRPQVAAFLVQRGCQTDPFLAACIGDVTLLETLVSQEPEGVHVRTTRQRFPTTPRAGGHIYLFTLGEDSTLLHAAASENHPRVVRRLVKDGLDPDVRGGYDDAAPLHQAAWEDRTEAAAALLGAGADPNLRSGKIHENEPIGWAIVGGSVHVARLLLDRGCTLRRTHLEDAAAGARGEFKKWKRTQPLERWQELEQLLSAHAKRDS